MNKRISYVYDPADGCADITVPAAMIKEFQVMVSRATSTWQDMSPDMRDFADRVLNRDHVVGSNMKEGFQTIGHNIPPVSPVILEAVALATKQIATRSCCGTMLREPHLASCAELSKIKRICDGHPETCNCPIHCK